LVDVNVQLQITDELMGGSPGLDEAVEKRRQENYVSFMKGVEKDNRYLCLDVPYIAYKYRDIWGPGIQINHNYPHMRRAFRPKDLARIESYMRLMIIASNMESSKCGTAS